MTASVLELKQEVARLAALVSTLVSKSARSEANELSAADPPREQKVDVPVAASHSHAEQESHSSPEVQASER